MYCLGQFVVVYKQNSTDVAHVVIDMFIPTKFHVFICFGFLVNEEQNFLSYGHPFILNDVA